MTTAEALHQEVDRLAEPQQLKLLEFARTLGAVHPLPPGKSLAEMQHLIGLISPEDLDEMQKAIEEGCENIDVDGWR